MDLETAVLDALADDFESIQQIKNYLCFMGFELQLQDIQGIITKLLNKELIYIVEDISESDFVWYGMTERGRCIWANTD